MWRKGKVASASVVALLIICWLMFRVVSVFHMLGYVPSKFGLTARYSEGACIDGFVGYMGAFAVGLDAETVQQIEEKGIDFFSDVGGPRNEDRGIYFKDWAETPLPAEAFSATGMPGHLDCGSQYGWFWPSGLQEALQTRGSYYSGDYNGRSAFVIPSMRLIVINMHTR